MVKYYLILMDSDDIISIDKYRFSKSFIKYSGLVRDNYRITCNLIIIEDEQCD